MKNTNNKIAHIGELVKELQGMVGFKEVAIAPDVPPGASLQALVEAYRKAGLELEQKALQLRRKYSPANINLALKTIYGDLERQVYG
ncbi:hypothetical protein HYX02_02315 [Candidatus Woesearchaeota archaeon]|nr:hypothetical protein [Candidatus Woesearchaeota archaeon]